MKKDILIWVGSFGLLVLGIIANFMQMEWFVLVPIELIFMAMVIIGTKK